jgi:hypothetical protein
MAYLFAGIAVAILCHWRIRDFQRATTVAVVVTVLVVFVADFLIIGFLDPFWPISLSVGLLIATVVSSLVGLPFRSVRTRASIKGERR